MSSMCGVFCIWNGMDELIYSPKSCLDPDNNDCLEDAFKDNTKISLGLLSHVFVGDWS